MANTPYFSDVKKAADAVLSIMQAKGYNLAFGGEGLKKTRISVPTDARSEFLANRALGDWAEKTLAGALRKEAVDWGVAHYGQSDSVSAGEEGFKEFFTQQLELVRQYGKRPDLLIFPDRQMIETYPDSDISMEGFEALDPLARHALTSIEVRSSKVEAWTYMNARREDVAAGRATASTRITPSFTMKIEDLVVVYRWLERYRIPQSYCQVFFDSIWAMNVLDMLKWVATNPFKIDNPDKSQGKATILIPITAGVQVGTFRHPPKQRIQSRVSRLGRHDSYIEPVLEEDNLELDFAALRQVILR